MFIGRKPIADLLRPKGCSHVLTSSPAFYNSHRDQPSLKVRRE